MSKTASRGNSLPNKRRIQRLCGLARKIASAWVGLQQEYLGDDIELHKMAVQAGINPGQVVFEDSGAASKHGRVFGCGSSIGGRIEELCSVHDDGEEHVRVMLNVGRVQHVYKRMVLCAHLVASHVDGVSFDNPQHGGEYLVHALTIANVGMHLAPDKQNVQHHVLGGGLAKVDIVGHASLNFLEDFGAQFFVGSQRYPWGLFKA